MRRRLTFANVISLLALFVALGGSATAVVAITGAQVENGSLTGADIKNRSVTGADVKAHTLLAKHFRKGQLRAGAVGPRGPAGPKGDKGDPCTGADASCRGPQGPPGENKLSFVNVAGANVAALGPDTDGTATADCPAGQVVTGGGHWLISGNAADYRVTRERAEDGPNGRNTRWVIAAKNTGTGDVTFTGEAFCAPVEMP